MTCADGDSGDTDETDLKTPAKDLGRFNHQNSTTDPRSRPVSFFDVGGLLDGNPSRIQQAPPVPVIQQMAQSTSMSVSHGSFFEPRYGDLQDVGGLLSRVSLHQPASSPSHRESIVPSSPLDHSAVAHASSIDHSGGRSDSSLSIGALLTTCESSTESSPIPPVGPPSTPPNRPRNFSRPSTSPSPPSPRSTIPPSTIPP